MASSTKQFSLFFLLITLLYSLHTHARDSQFFNKISSTTTTTTTKINTKQPQQQQQQEEPNFLPDNENAYGLYGHESGQLPPSTTINDERATTTRSTTPYNTESKLPPNKHLPKNYNPVAYVTEPEEDINDNEKFTQEKSYTTTNYNNNDAQYNNQQEQYEDDEDQESYLYRNNYNNNNYNNKNYNNNNYYKGMSETRFRGGGAAATSRRAQPQGLSDTRFMENGKYFYDVNTEKNEYRNMNFNGYEFNNNDNSINGGYHTQDNNMP